MRNTHGATFRRHAGGDVIIVIAPSSAREDTIGIRGVRLQNRGEIRRVKRIICRHIYKTLKFPSVLCPI